MKRIRTAEHNRKIGIAHQRGQYFTCLICGKRFWRKPFEIAGGNNKYCSKQCYGEAQRGIKRPGVLRARLIGKDNPNWRGGITPVTHSIRYSKEAREWRENVFRRDNWTCQHCGARSKSNQYIRIEAHHIKPFATFPELRFVVDNGKTLCKKCHDREPKGKDIYSIK